jgi:hypothetical protein
VRADGKPEYVTDVIAVSVAIFESKCVADDVAINFAFELPELISFGVAERLTLELSDHVSDVIAISKSELIAFIESNASLQHGNSQQLPKPSKSALSC